LTVLRILFATFFVYWMCRAAGYLLLRVLSFTLRRSERYFFEFLAGVPLVSSLVFLLASTHLVYTRLLVTVGAAIMICAVVLSRRAPEHNRPAEYPPLSLTWRIVFWLPYLVFAGLYIVTAMGPEISPDGTGYHVGLIARYYEHRGFYSVATNQFAGLGEGIEMLFLIAFALGRHSATATVHLLFLLTLPFGMMAWSRRAGVPKAGIIGALLFYLAPVVGKDGTIAYIDVATAAVVFAMFFFLELWRNEQLERALVPAGILAGFAYACKITASTAIIYAFLCVAVVSIRRREKIGVLRPVALLVGFASLMAVPWMLKDAIQFGNPFFPLFNHWFPNPYQYPMVEMEMRRLMMSVSGVTFSQIPYQATIGGKLFGVLGPVFVLAPLALLSLRTKAGRVLALAFVPIFLPYFTNIGARFLIPSLPFLALALGIGLLSIPRIGMALAVTAVLAHAGLSWPENMNAWSPGFQWRIDQTSWRLALRLTSEKDFLEKFWPDYKPGLLLDQFVAPGERVFSPGMGQMAYHHREILGTWDSAAARRAFITYLMAIEEHLGATWNRELRFPTVTTDRIRLVSDTKMDTDLRISEVRFALDSTEIPRRPAWRLTASANPFEVQYAFDNSSVSWWTSGAPVEKGTWLQTSFGTPSSVNRVLIAQSEDQRWIALQPEAWVDGKWTSLRSRETDVREPPRATLRMEVRDELKRLNIHWILMPDTFYGADDLRANAPYWGITQMGEVNGFRLWRLN